MKNRVLTAIAALSLLAGDVCAQGYVVDEYTKEDSLISGTKEYKDAFYLKVYSLGDSKVECMQNLYPKGQKAEKEGDVVTAMDYYGKYYNLWQEVFEEAPLYSLKYLYVTANQVFYSMIKNTADLYERKVLYGDMMNMWSTRIANFRELNILNPTEVRTKASLVMDRAFWYYIAAFSVYGDDQEGQKNINFEKAYNLFDEGVKCVQEEGGRDVPANVLKQYMELSTLLLSKNPDKYEAMFIDDYDRCYNLADSMLNAVRDPEWGMVKYDGDLDWIAEEKDKVIRQYDDVKIYCDSMFYGSKIDGETIVRILEPRIEDDKNDIDKLNKYIDMLLNNDLDSVPCYFRASEYAYAIRPTYQGAIGSAKKMMEDGNLNGAIDRYNQAINMADEDSKKASIAMKVARSLMNADREQEAINYYDKAARYDRNVAGTCYLKLGQLYAKKNNFKKSREYLNQVAGLDITLAPAAERILAQVDRNEQNFNEHAAAMREWNAAKKKQQEEDDFWNKGKK